MKRRTVLSVALFQVLAGAIASSAVSAHGETAWHLPVTIEAQQDLPAHAQETQRQARGVLYVAIGQSFWVKKGQRFLMVEVHDEGGCRIEFENVQYDVSSCPWLDGFSDHQEDFFKVISGRSNENQPQGK